MHCAASAADNGGSSTNKIEWGGSDVDVRVVSNAVDPTMG